MSIILQFKAVLKKALTQALFLVPKPFLSMGLAAMVFFGLAPFSGQAFYFAPALDYEFAAGAGQDLSILGANSGFVAADLIGGFLPANQEEQAVWWQPDSYLSASHMPITFISQQPREEIIFYQVQTGDNPFVIAAKYGITVNTLLWANGLEEGDYIRPGDKLEILPISGVKHQVKAGDTISGLAKIYNTEEQDIIEFNNLAQDGAIKAGDELIMPGGVKSQNQYNGSRSAKTHTSGLKLLAGSHSFPYGYCTWYVATRRVVPWSGHARSWLANAKAMGYGTGPGPKVGAIMVMKSPNPLGHVAYVEAVNGNWITISEMNAVGFGVKNFRAISRNSNLIRGYIY